MVSKTDDNRSPDAQHAPVTRESTTNSSDKSFKDKLMNPFPHLREKLKDTHLHDIKVGAIHLKHRLGKLENLTNANHRHDEEHEQRTDAKRTGIAEGHRFQSFAPERAGNRIKWYIDGRDYFHAVSVALERAKESIYIMDWWLSPELFLRRPPHFHQEWRLDYTLKRAAERGVKIYVIVYKEVKQALTCNSIHTKHALEALCPEGSPGYKNIVVMRHPDHNVFENGSDMTFYFAHHEKAIVIDYDLAFIGGLDLCFGRWDNRQHALADVHPAGVQNEIFPGQDFNNNRIMDFQDVDDWKSNELSKADYGRMPWHDVAMGVIGPCVYDIAEHFVLRWNFCKRDKYKRDPEYDWLTMTGRTGDDEDLIGVQRPKYPVGEYVHHPLSPLENKTGNPHQGRLARDGSNSDGAETEGFTGGPEDVDEHGYTKYQHRIRHGAEEFIHEHHHLHRPHLHSNQESAAAGAGAGAAESKQENAKVTGNDPRNEGMITASGGREEKQKGYHSEVVHYKTAGGQGSVHAQLVRSSADWSSGILVEQSIQNAYCQIIRDAKHFVYIENQFFITATGENQAPIHNQIGAAIVDACITAAKEDRKFRVILMLPCIPGFAGDLRSNAAAGTRAIMDYQYKSICRGEESIFGKIQAAGYDPNKYISCFNLRSYDRLNKTSTLKKLEEKSGINYQQLQREQAEEVMGQGLSGAPGEGKKHHHGKQDKDKGPQSQHHAKDEYRKGLDDNGLAGEGQAEELKSTDSIAKNAMLGTKNVSEETYAGRDENGQPLDGQEDEREQEKDNFVQEELYIHGKTLIVDDRIVICGSSNINDRSQLGFHDSELSIVMEDTHTIESTMNGQPYLAGYHAATLRRMLWREHLGLLPAQDFDADNDYGINAQPPNDGDNEWYASDEHDAFVADPLSDELWDRWTSQATVNTQVFRQLFHADPDNHIKTFDDYDKFLPKAEHIKQGHLFDPYQPVENVRKELDRIKGHLVWMPLDFLRDAEMAERGLQVNAYTESVYT